MNSTKRKRLEAKGWKVGNVQEFLNLLPEEAAYIELKLALSKNLQDYRKAKRLTQTELARRIKSSQSRVAKKVTINAGSDFVFDRTYELMPLEDVEIYINENKHLPDIQSAKEMEENGIELGKMDMKLLQKLEELTLYLISLKKEIEALKEENKTLKK